MALERATIIRYYSVPHPQNPWLQIATYGDTQFITGTHYDQGTLGIFIPADYIVPHNLLEDMELVGLLSGPEKNRVKASKFKGVLSQGIFYGSQVDGHVYRGWNPSWQEGDDVTDEIGVKLWINPEVVK